MTYITPHKAFAHLDRLTGWQLGQRPSPVTVEWDLSNRCSLGCQDCHFAHTHTKGPWASKPRLLPMAYEGTGDLADVAVVRRGLRELAQAGVEGVVWSGGGEPTLHPAWQEIVDYAASLGLQQGMYTLGGHLTRQQARDLAWKATFVVVSLDAETPETYAAEKGVPAERFGQAVDGIRWLAEAKGATVGVSFLLHGENWTRVERMLALARSLGATYATFRPAIRTSPDQPGVVLDDRKWLARALDPAYDTVLKQVAREKDVEIDLERFAAYRDWAGHGYDACYGIRLSTTITPDGRVWICPQRRGVTALGDLSKESFADVWARHPGQWTDFGGCRAMCRLHLTNQVLASVYQPRKHEAFV